MNLTSLSQDQLLIQSLPAYRRLANKTQVFSNIMGSNGHLHRTRLTHSNEVAALSSYVAGRLGLNPELAGILGLSHDIGHSCFGHVGQDAISDKLQQYTNGADKFEHNSQAIRILEQSSLTKNKLNPLILNGLRKRAEHGLTTACNYGESQVMDICDVICYLSSDIQDALSLNVITLDQIMNHIADDGMSVKSLLLKTFELKQKAYPNLTFEEYYSDEGFNNIMNDLRKLFTESVIETSKKLIVEHRITHSDDFLHQETQMIAFGSLIAFNLLGFMYENVYHSEHLEQERADFIQLISNLFDYFMADDNYLKLGNGAIQRFTNGQVSKARAVADYIGGCDDKYARLLHFIHCKEKEYQFKSKTLTKSFQLLQLEYSL